MPRPSPSVPIVYPTTRPWNGRVLGLYVRNSTTYQRGNDSSVYQGNLADWLLGQGYAVAVYDEQARSATRGFARGGQRHAQNMLADLASGALDDIATVHLDHLTREYTGEDADVTGATA